jgi:hypothetical protein
LGLPRLASGEILPRLFIAAPFFIDYGYLGCRHRLRSTLRYGPTHCWWTYDDHIVDVIYNAFY